MFDPYPQRDVSAPATPERSPMEPVRAFGRRSLKDRFDNAKWAGQRRALESLDPPPARQTPRPQWDTEHLT